MRKNIVAIVAPVKDCLCIHFCEPRKLQGDDFDLWFPLTKTSSVDCLNFEEVEQILTVNYIAHNLTSIKALRPSGRSMDYEIVFNAWEDK